ncbi:AraC family transcriptional regulator [Paenibacillus rhizovicinus]|uniref:AraC family transcriptional regulator n=1 Tax=Paenibacillus rhizovicinus TaxID=2704463 RepID=A0A6C0P5M5_9BACL|nr:helix-turn-helix domain-containing protein [Paenibacillus rhizovicinus]QHW33860.1 AraC family transcriptional regulator [Paenibacillus rhizovicinus]
MLIEYEETLATEHRRYVAAATQAQTLPLYLESIGFNPAQEPIQRRNGYPLYHWLETVEGEGDVRFHGRALTLPPGSGILLMPGEPHEYRRSADIWRTRYVTFGGAAAPGMLESLGMSASASYRWEADSPMAGMLPALLAEAARGGDVFGLDASRGVYGFLLTLWKFGQARQGSGISQSLQRIAPLLEWLEASLQDPSLNLGSMSEHSSLSPRRLNTLFHQLFGLSPYAYLLQLRIRRSQELLVSRSGRTVAQIGQDVGFRDASHFVATFRRHTGETPERFRLR